MLYWYHNEKQCMWEFIDDQTNRRVVARVVDEIIWEARQEPGRSGLQAFLRKRGIDPLPDRAFTDD